MTKVKQHKKDMVQKNLNYSLQRSKKILYFNLASNTMSQYFILSRAKVEPYSNAKWNGVKKDHMCWGSSYSSKPRIKNNNMRCKTIKTIEQKNEYNRTMEWKQYSKYAYGNIKNQTLYGVGLRGLRWSILIVAKDSLTRCLISCNDGNSLWT